MASQKNICAVFFTFALLFIFYENSLVSGCSCGRAQPNRIIGGTNIGLGTYPWMTLMISDVGDNMQQICGATLISEYYAVTAYHCTSVSASKTFLLAGTVNINSYEQRLSVDKFIPYTNIPRSKDDDIALVKLSSPAEFGQNVQPICLPPSGKSFAGSTAYFCGFGVTKPDSYAISHVLKGGSAVVPSNTKCNKDMEKMGGYVGRHQICCGTFGGAPATCFGDSGGPLMYYDSDKGVWELIGVVSGTYSCSDTGGYGFFTNVALFVTWIQSNSGNSGCIK